MLVSSHNEHEENKLSQTENDSNSQSRSRPSFENKLHNKLQNRLIDIDHDKLNTYQLQPRTIIAILVLKSLNQRTYRAAIIEQTE